MKLFAIHYHGSYCMLVQIVRASSSEAAQAMADAVMKENGMYDRYSIKDLDADTTEGLIFEAGYIE